MSNASYLASTAFSGTAHTKPKLRKLPDPGPFRGPLATEAKCAAAAASPKAVAASPRAAASASRHVAATARPVPTASKGRAVGVAGGKGTWQTDAKNEPDPILFQTYFKSIGPRTYATQLRRARNGNHYLVFTEGKRDKVTDEVRKTRLYLYSEDFASFFKMLKETAEYIRAHPMPAATVQKRERYWQKQNAKAKQSEGRRPFGR